MSKVLIYLLRRDLRLADNPVFHEIARLGSQSHRPFTHVLPVYVFPAEQIEVSGFLSSGGKQSPYPEARSRVGGFWRCGRLRATFIAESVFDLRRSLESVGSGLIVRVGSVKDVVQSLIDGLRDKEGVEVHGLWMTSEEGWEEKIEEKDAKSLLEAAGKEFKLWQDEKYFIDDRDLPFDDIQSLSNVFTTFRKTVEPLRAAPRQQLPACSKLLPLPEVIPPQASPFTVPDNLDEFNQALLKPLPEDAGFSDMPKMPKGTESAHPFKGGAKSGSDRVKHLIESGSMTAYKETRNGLLGLDFSTKLSAWLALGCITARQVHWMLMDFEDGKGDIGKDAKGYGQGENNGTAGVRFELLWRDYMRLCTRKFGSRLFDLGGFAADRSAQDKFISSPFTKSTKKKNAKGANDEDTRNAVERFIRGQTGTGLIDASQRELFLTGYTSNRARQNVASFLSKHLGIDWRIGAEWYESNLIDYDVSSNWGNWQYVAGVGNDPRGSARVFNPIKQAFDYDGNGDYVRAWIPELRDVGLPSDGEGNKKGQDLMCVFQPWRMSDEEKKRVGLAGVEWVEKPLIRIEYSVNRRGNAGRGGGRGGGSRQGRGGRRGGHGKGRDNDGKKARSGMMEKAGWEG